MASTYWVILKLRICTSQETAFPESRAQFLYIFLFPPLGLLVLLSGSIELSVRDIRVSLKPSEATIHLFSHLPLCFARLLTAPAGFDLIQLLYHLPLTLFWPFIQHLISHCTPFYCCILNMQFSTFKTSERKSCSWDSSWSDTNPCATPLLFPSFIQLRLPCWYLVSLSFVLSPPARDLFSSSSVVLKL